MIDRRRRRRALSAFGLAAVVALGPGIVSCGKKGPPLPPLRLVPAPVTDVSARRSADRVELGFVLPTTNQNGAGRIDLGRVEVYAVTIAPGAAAPGNAELLTRTNLIGSVPVRPAPRESEEPAAAGAADTRPGPGERATFVEPLTPETLVPAVPAPKAAQAAGGGAPPSPPPAVPAAPPAAAPKAGTVDAPPMAAASEHPTRIYVVRGTTAGGRPGAPGPRLAVPLGPPPAPPTNVEARFTERAIVLDWVAPVAEPAGPAPSFTVYRADADDRPLNPSPIAATAFEQPGIVFGEERCYVVRAIVATGNVALESAASSPRCVTPTDTFPPAAPASLQVVAAPDAVELSWDANTESDLAGYIVLRGEAPGDTLQPLMSTPTRETTWRDTTVQSGARYVYAVIALDSATPANASPQSARQEVIAR